MGDVGVSDWLLGSLVRATAERLCLFENLFSSKSILHIQHSQSILHNYLLRKHSDNNHNTTEPSN